jgi:hypothetical protein
MIITLLIPSKIFQREESNKTKKCHQWWSKCVILTAQRWWVTYLYLTVRVANFSYRLWPWCYCIRFNKIFLIIMIVS